jgi:uncharacterized membrane protein (UPF0182 family)
MFALSYVMLVLIAALPLAMTVLQNRGNPPSLAFIHRVYRDLAYIALVVVGIIAIETIFAIALQNYWFSEVGQQYRYWLALGLRVAIFATVFVLGGLFIAFNLRSGCRLVAILPRSAPWCGGFILSALVSFGATSLWTPLLAFLGTAPSGVTDPVFGKDLSFYLLALPLYGEVIYLVITILVLTIAAWGFVDHPDCGRASIRRPQPDYP